VTVCVARIRRGGSPERTLTCPTLREARKQRDLARSAAWEGKHTQGEGGRRKTVSELCRDEREWTAGNPVRLVTKPKDRRPQEERQRVRFLSADERARLPACAQSQSPWLHQIVLMALVTGARKSEILTLHTRDTHVQAGTVCFRNPVNGSDRTAAPAGPTVTLMRECRGEVTAHPEAYVFPAPCGTKPIRIRTAWDAAARKAQLEDFRFHDLRRGAASSLRMGGHSLEDIGDVLGRRSLRVTRRYAHLDDSYQRKMLGSKVGKVFGEGGGL
jgi:integrase